MAEPLKIKVSIAERVYPLTVPPEQEEGLRTASKKIEEMIKRFEQNYAVRDKQDVLAMCALQLATELEQKKIDKSENTQQILSRLKTLDKILEDKLS